MSILQLSPTKTTSYIAISSELLDDSLIGRDARYRRVESGQWEKRDRRFRSGWRSVSQPVWAMLLSDAS